MPLDVTALVVGDATPAPDVQPGAPARTTPQAARRPWSALVCGMPGDGTLLLVDWLLLACSELGCAVSAVPVGGGANAVHGMYLEVATAEQGEEGLSDQPGGPVDLLVAGEHLELVRAIGAGYAHASVTTVVSSCRRAFSVAEHMVAPQHVLREREIDAVAQRSSQRYVAFDGPEVAGWYGLPAGAQPGLLLGAVCGSGVLGLDERRCRAAIARLGIDVTAHAQAFAKGVRLGRRSGGRVRRTTTAAQFVRKRRGSLPRDQRAGFEAVVNRVEEQFDVPHRGVLREAVYALTDYHSAEYAAAMVEQCALVAREEDALHAAGTLRVEPERSLVPTVARGLASLLAYSDLAHVAHVKLRRRRLRDLRRAHGISRRETYELRDHLPIERHELAQLQGSRLRRFGNATGSPLLSGMTVKTIVTTSVTGALQLRRMRSLRRNRLQTARHALERDAAELYVAAVRETMTLDHDLALLVAESAALVYGYGAARAGTRATGVVFWGRVVRSCLGIDASAPGSDGAFSRLVIPHVYSELCRSGHLALWEYAAQIVGISMQLSRGLSYEDALTYARALCDGPSPAPVTTG